MPTDDRQRWSADDGAVSPCALGEKKRHEKSPPPQSAQTNRRGRTNNRAHRDAQAQRMRKEGDARATGLPLLWPTEREGAQETKTGSARVSFFLFHQNRFVLLSNVCICVCMCMAVAGTCWAHTHTQTRPFAPWLCACAIGRVLGGQRWWPDTAALERSRSIGTTTRGARA